MLLVESLRSKMTNHLLVHGRNNVFVRGQTIPYVRHRHYIEIGNQVPATTFYVAAVAA